MREREGPGPPYFGFASFLVDPGDTHRVEDAIFKHA